MAVKKKRSKSQIAIGTWPTPEKTRGKKKAKKRTGKKRVNPRAIDTVPLPDKPVRKKKRAGMKAKKKAVKKK